VPFRESAPLGAPCWIDLFTSDPDKAREFYGRLFGWTSESAGDEYGGYINFSKDGRQVAGCMRNDGSAGMPDVWSVYLAVADAEATVADATARGAQVIVPAMPVGPLGTMAVLIDTGHAAIGLWQPGLHKGFAVMAEAGAASWFELHTRDYDTAVNFYRDVFNWDTHVASDAPDFRYTTFGEGDAALAGIMDASAFLPEGVPAHWQIYFGVDDTDAALAKIVELGGAIEMDAADSLYGRLAQAADPTGAMFRIVAGA
jgi:predicted enzyme related to lactoylglutathione lyase